MVTIVDHNGKPVEHGFVRVNGFRIHYVTAGSGPALCLIHGIPKTLSHWRFVIPLLTHKFTVVAPDIRGIGDSERPSEGYDMTTMSEDVALLMEHLGHKRYGVAGEDWGAAVAYQLAARHPDRVEKLVYQEMILPGFGLEEKSHLTPDNVATSVWLWHVAFYATPQGIPELLITGREREYFSWFIRRETRNPSAITPEALDEYIRCYSGPAGIRSMCQIYRATMQSGEQNRELSKKKLPMPVLAVGGEEFIGADTERQMKEVAENVNLTLLPAGHQLAEELPEKLAEVYLNFFS